MDTVISERSREFGAAYEDFDPEDIGKLIISTGDWLEKLMGAAATDLAMKALYLAAFGQEPPAASLWRPLWEKVDVNELMLLPKADILTSLNGYAFWGLPLDPENTVEGNEKKISSTIDELRALLNAVPAGWAELPFMEQTVQAAEGRWRLDHGQSVTVEQLAALARISLKRLRNLLTPLTQSGLTLDGEGKIVATVALAWLTSREDFKNSVWREVKGGSTPLTAAQSGDLGPVVFVPVAQDGSWFSPDLKRAGHYTIGAKGAEETVDDYLRALDKLSRMLTPRWRRPNPNNEGRWGIVSAARWDRRMVIELEDLARSEEGDRP